MYYRDVFTNNKNLCFDEYWHLGLSDKWKQLYPEKIWDSRLFDDIRIPETSMNFVSVFHPEYSDSLISYMKIENFSGYILPMEKLKKRKLCMHIFKDVNL